MAGTNLGTAWIQIKPSMKGLTSEIKNELSGIENNLETTADKAGKNNGKSWARSFAENAAGFIATSSVFKKISSTLSEAIGVGSEFGSSISQIAATLGYSMEDLNDSGSDAARTMDRLRSYAKEMGSTTTFTARQSAEALNYMALAGYDAETSIKMLPGVLNLAAAGNFELAQASDMVTDAQTALGLNLEQTVNLVDQMARTASKSNTSVAQLGEAILTVGGTAKYMTGGTTELNTVLGILANNGVKGAEAGTHLRNILLSMSSPTKNAIKLLDDLGVKIFDSDGKMRSFSKIFPELNAAMSEFTDEKRLDAFSVLFNTRDIASATALLGASAEEWRDLSGEISNSAGAAQEMAGVQLDNLAGDTTLLNSAWEGFQITLSEKLEPLLRTVTKGLTNLVEWISDNWEWLEPIFGIILGFLGSLTAIFAAKTVWMGLSAIFGLIWQNPIIAMIGLIVGAITVLITHFDEIKAVVETVFGAIGEAIGGFAEWVGGVFNGIWETITGIFSHIGDFFVGVWNTITSIFVNVGTFIGEAVSGAFKSVVNGILGFIEGFVNTPINILNGFLDLINGAFGWLGVNLSHIDGIHLPRLYTGGIVEGIGTDTSDSNLYALSKGEYVIRAAAAREIGYDNLARMNETGEVSGGQTINITINGYNKSPEELATIVSRKIAFNQRGVLA